MRWHLEVAYNSIRHLDETQQWQAIPAEMRNSWELFTQPVERPVELDYLWRWFIELHHARSNNGMGPSVITYQDILAWSQMTGNRPQRFELETIKSLDHIYFESLTEGKENRHNKGEDH